MSKTWVYGTFQDSRTSLHVLITWMCLKIHDGLCKPRRTWINHAHFMRIVSQKSGQVAILKLIAVSISIVEMISQCPQTHSHDFPYASKILPIYKYIQVHMYIYRIYLIYPSIHLSIYPSTHPSIHLSIYLSLHPSIYPSIYQSIKSLSPSTKCTVITCFRLKQLKKEKKQRHMLRQAVRLAHPSVDGPSHLRVPSWPTPDVWTPPAAEQDPVD